VEHQRREAMTFAFDPKVMDRLDSRVQRGGDDDCWPWLGGRSKRGTPHMHYSKVKGQCRSGSPRRLVWERFHGSPPDRRFSITFTCKNLLCMNPRHMLNLSVEDRFWLLVNKDGPTMPHMTTPCWEWIGRKQHGGYGQFCPLEGRHFSVHRYSYELAKGPIEGHIAGVRDVVVMHACDNRVCVNPAHLSLGTHADNHADMRAKGRQSRGPRHGQLCKAARSGLPHAMEGATPVQEPDVDPTTLDPVTWVPGVGLLRTDGAQNEPEKGGAQ
jgi:hypothetical protein